MYRPNFVRRPHLFSIMIVIAGLGVITGVTVGLSRRAKPQQSIRPTVKSTTAAVQVVSSNLMTLANSQVLMVKLQNVSGKDIKMFTISAGNTYVTRNYLFGEDSFKAGATIDEMISLSDTAKGEIVIAAVLFADATGDGDSRHVRMLAGKRAGMRDQANRMLSKLGRLSDDSRDEKALAELEAQAFTLPTKGKDLVSPDYDEGLETFRTVLLKRVKEIKDQRASNHLDEANSKQAKLKKVFESLVGPPSN